MKYTIEAGRCILRDGVPFATLHGVGDYSPAELDAFARSLPGILERAEGVPVHQALSFEPQAIRDHFDGEEGPEAKWVAKATDEQLEAVAMHCLELDSLYEAFHEALCYAVGEAIDEEEQ